MKLWFFGAMSLVVAAMLLMTSPGDAYVTSFPAEPDIDGACKL